MTLFDNGFAPTSFTIGFLQKNLDHIANADKVWRERIGRYADRVLRGNLSSMLSELEPLSGPQTRCLWVQTKSNWTAYFDNSINGSDPFGPISHLSRQLGCRGLIVSCCPDIRGLSYGQTRFDVYGEDPVDIFNCTRVVAATNDGGRWSWDQVGKPLAFEEIASYSQRKIKHRFTPEQAIRYCLAYGVNPYAEEFYGECGLLVENLMIPTTDCRTETYAKVNSRLKETALFPRQSASLNRDLATQRSISKTRGEPLSGS